MTPRSLATNQVRRRKRRIPSTPPAPEIRIRVYCPTCFEVQRAYGNFRALYGNQVRPHRREVVIDGEQRGRTLLGEAVTSVCCPGGTVDLVKDRAP